MTAECWLQIGIEAERENADEVAEALAHAGALAVTFEDAADDAVLEPAPGETPLWRHTVVIGLFADGTDAGLILRKLQRGLDLDQPPKSRIGVLRGEEWEQAWRRDFHPMRFGSRLWVTPFDQPVTAPAVAVVRLDPGLAFGTGTHPTTALCLEWLAEYCRIGDIAVDYGCGSGILGIAAAKLGAAEVWAVDLDPQALMATDDNAARNGVADRVHVVPPERLKVRDADCVIANILAGPLVELMPRFAALLRNGGHLVLSGLLADQASSVGAALRPAFELIGKHERDGWMRLDASRR